MSKEKRYELIPEFDKVINKTKWIDAEDYFQIEPFLRQAEIEIERQTRRDVIARLQQIEKSKAKEGKCDCFACIIKEFKEKFSM